MNGILHVGDNRAILPTIPDASVDSIVTDPPYELGFMGKAWDASGIAYDVEMWRECLRVLKPGGYLLAFGGTRTYHRMACAIEDAGFEIRDQIQWIYATGFPKSLDVSKAIDKASRRDYVLAAIELGLNVPGNNLHDWTKAEHSPGDVWWNRFKEHLTESQWRAIEREVVGKGKSGKTAIWSEGGMGDFSITLSATDAAKQWEGWGTALKPANEPICFARKPFPGTVAANVLEYGTGAINVDGCRIPTTDKLGGGDTNAATAGQSRNKGWRRPWMDRPDSLEVHATKVRANVARAESLGRWPSNTLFDDVTSQVLDVKAGPGTSRFFYVAKPSPSERNEDGNTHATVKPVTLMRYLVRLVTPKGGTVLDPFFGSGTTGVACEDEGFRWIGIEALEEHAEIARRRLGPKGLFALMEESGQ